jgi:hypothetical protein
MKFLLTTATLCAAISAMNFAQADGPVRAGLRRTGEIAVEGTRRVVEGTAQAARGVGEAAVGTVARTGEAAGNIAAGTARGVRNGVDALTPNTSVRTLGDRLATMDQSRNARWRFARQDGEWWYYTPQNTWMYHRDGQWRAYDQASFRPLTQTQGQMVPGQLPQGQQHTTGYRGVPQQNLNNAPAPTDQGAIQGDQLQTVQPIPQNAAPVTSGAYYRGSSGGEVSRVPSGSYSRTQAVGNPAAPREINNNPSPATYGAVEK